MPLGVTSHYLSPRSIVQESLFLQELGPVGLYYSLAYRLVDLWEWVCFFLCWLGLLSVGDAFLLG